jgi:hypothetical protein
MSRGDIASPDEDIRALIRRAREVDAAPTHARARVLERVEGAISSGGGGNGDGPPDASGTPRHGGTLRLASGAIVFALGVATGALATRALVRTTPVVRELAPRIVYVERPTATAAFAEEPSTTAPVQPPVTPDRPTHPLPAGEPPTANAPSVRIGVSEERVLLDEARGALESEDWKRALAATKEHERRFPSGLLVQEREAMAVRALTMMGRHEEANARTEQFRRRFPDSPLLPALEAFVEAGSTKAP